MSDEKSSEMSFSDWKKMKNALNATDEKPNSAKPKKGQVKKTPNNNYNNNRQNNNNQNNSANNWGNNLDYREQERLQYFENLKQNQVLMMQAALSSALNSNMARNNIGAFNNNMARNNMGVFNNNMGQFNNNFGPFNRNLFNNMNLYNNNMNSFNQGMNSLRNNMGPMPLMQQRPPQLMAQRTSRPDNRNLFNNRRFADNYMGRGNDFVSMLDMPIPQQPFGQNKNIPSLMSQQPFNQKKNIPSLMSIRMQKKGLTANKTSNAKKPDESKQKKETKTPKDEGNEATTETATTSNTAQKKSKQTKQNKNWKPPKPQMPPPVIALTPEAQEAKKRMWREYRQNMKPFKNKDYLNAKRAIQRLKKKPFEEFDEKEKERWERANEFVNNHKKKLSERSTARGDAVSAPSPSVENALHSDNELVESPLNKDSTSSSKNDSSQESSGNSNELPTSSEGVGTSENWELWSSFVPGGVLFNSTGASD